MATAVVSLVLNVNLSLKHATRCKHALIHAAPSVIVQEGLGTGSIF